MVALATPGPYYLPGEAARLLNITTFKLHRERKAGRIPECVRIGQYHVIPADKLDAIRSRLIEAGRINPSRELPLIPTPATV